MHFSTTTVEGCSIQTKERKLTVKKFIQIVIVAFFGIALMGCQTARVNNTQNIGGSSGRSRTVAGTTTKTISHEKSERFDKARDAVAATQGKHNLVFYPCISESMTPDKSVPLSVGEVQVFFTQTIPSSVEEGMRRGLSEAEAKRLVRYCGGVHAEWKELESVDVPVEAEEEVPYTGGGNYANNSVRQTLQFSFFENAQLNVGGGGFGGGGRICPPMPRGRSCPPPRQYYPQSRGRYCPPSYSSRYSGRRSSSRGGAPNITIINRNRLKNTNVNRY